MSFYGNKCWLISDMLRVAILSFSKTVHRALDAIQLLQCETPNFISSELWPPNSPDMNLGGNKIWEII